MSVTRTISHAPTKKRFPASSTSAIHSSPSAPVCGIRSCPELVPRRIPPAMKQIGVKMAQTAPTVESRRARIDGDLRTAAARCQSLALVVIERMFYSRSVRVEYRMEPCKSALTQVRGMPFRWSLNPYMGCVHRCTFCYVRHFEQRADRPSDDRYGRSIR